MPNNRLTPYINSTIRLTVLGILAALPLAPAGAVVPARGNPKMKIASKAARVYPFLLTDVRLLDGPFKHSQELDEKYLLTVEPDRLLSRFREYAGLKPKAEAYGGWERDTISGHSLGHYLLACALMYASTGDERFKQRVDYVVDELAECQKAHGDGFVGGMPNGRKVFAEVAAGDIRSAGFDLNGSWVPWYNLHKTMDGLIHANIYCNSAKAKQVLSDLADWAVRTTSKLTEEQWQKMLACEHGGMNDVLADTYALTGKQAHLDLAKKFYHKRILDPLARREDPLTGVHANTQIPKIIGAARIHEVTGEDSFKTIASFFWDVVTRERSYVMGGNSDGEYFPPKERFSQYVGSATAETCNTHNMLKLTRHLFSWQPKAEYADYFERALYNHILSSQNPEGDGLFTYFMPLKTGSKKDFSSPFHSFTCCHGTGMENHAKHADSIYFHDGGRSLYVNLFIPSELQWKTRGVTVRQETRFPDEDTTRLTITASKPADLTLLVRKPYWAGQGVRILVNGEAQPVEPNAEGYIPVRRTWKSGDTLEAVMPMSVRTEGFQDNPRRLALMYGPVVLSAEVDTDREYPVILADIEKIPAAIRPVAGDSVSFRGEGIFRAVDGTGPREMTFIPFHRMYDRPYIVCWDAFSEEGWTAKQAEYRAELARQRALEARTVDFLQPGEMQPERDHKLEGERTHVGDHLNRKWRAAGNGGWFAFEMKVDPQAPLDMVCTYWGSDRWNREFEIQVDGKAIATQKLEVNKRDAFFDVTYPIPEELTRGKEKVTVRFQALPEKTAGALYGCRITRREGAAKD